MSSTTIVVIVLILLVAAVVGLLLARRRRSAQLQRHFGPEYERSLDAADGDRRVAEALLAERKQRREEFDVRDLSPEEAARFRDSWNEIQRGFVDDPQRSLHSADRLVAEVMQARGYPVDDHFDRRAADLSVDHPRVVQHYREARRVRDADETDTEQQRRAVTSYRALVEALLGDDGTHVSDRADDRADDAPATGRHALREPESARGVDGSTDRPTDPNGPQGPRTEERTR